MIRGLLAACAVMLMLAGCAGDQKSGPTYPVVGTVNQKDAQQAADIARASFAALTIAARQYVDLPRCGQPSSPPVCSSQSVVNEIRQYGNAADYATKQAQDFTRDLTKSPVAVANAVSDAQRAITIYRGTVAKFNAKAAKEA